MARRSSGVHWLKVGAVAAVAVVVYDKVIKPKFKL